MVINKLLNSSYSPTVQLSLIKSGLYGLEANSKLYASYVIKSTVQQQQKESWKK